MTTLAIFISWAKLRGRIPKRCNEDKNRWIYSLLLQKNEISKIGKNMKRRVNNDVTGNRIQKYLSDLSSLKNCYFTVKVKSESEVAQSCLTLFDPMDCSLPDSSVHGIFQVRVPGWVTISFSRRSSQPRDWTQVSRIVGRHFTVCATKDVLFYWTVHL